MNPLYRKNLKLLPILLLISALLLSLCACGGTTPAEEAEKLAKEGRYEEAADLYESAGEDDLALSCRYKAADAAWLSKDYQTAYDLFTALGSYQDSVSRASDAAMCLHSDTVSGDWYYVQGNADDLLASLQSRMADYEGLWDYCDYSGCSVTYRLSLYEDGSFTFCLDRDALMELADSMIDRTQDAVYAYLSDQVKDAYESQGITLEEVYKDLGVENMDELLAWLNYNPVKTTEKIISRGSFETAANSAVINGTYIPEDGQLIFRSDAGTEYEEISLDGTTMILRGPTEESTADILQMAGSYPAVFTRK